MGVPQFILLILMTISLGMNVAVKEGKQALISVLTYAIIMGLLWWGGFFS